MPVSVSVGRLLRLLNRACSRFLFSAWRVTPLASARPEAPVRGGASHPIVLVVVVLVDFPCISVQH